MNRKPDDPDMPPRRRSKMAWMVGGLIILLLVIVAVQGIVRGTGEAVGITEAAPGDDNVRPAPESTHTTDGAR